MDKSTNTLLGWQSSTVLQSNAMERVLRLCWGFTDQTTQWDHVERGQFFVCVVVLRPSQPNGVMSSAVNLPNHTFTGQA